MFILLSSFKITLKLELKKGIYLFNCLKKKKNLVVGAGFSGAVIAERLANIMDEDVLVIDKNSFLGGESFDYKDKSGIMVQKFGSHIFHTNYEYIWKYLNKFSKFNMYIHKENAFIEGNEANIPFNLNSVYKVFPKKLAARLEDKLVRKYGFSTDIPILDFKTKPFFWDRELDFLASYIYENVFIHYADKKWGTKKHKIDISVFVNRDDRKYKDKYQGIPNSGYTKLIENILNHKNIKILPEVDFKNIDTTGFDRIFYTGSIDEFFDYKFGVLQYRSANFEIEEINTEFYQKTGVVNYPNNYEFLKIHEFKHYGCEKTDRTIIAKEYVSDFVLDSKCRKNNRAYPVLNNKNLEIYKLYKNEARKFKDVYFLGRLGDFMDYSMDNAIKRALEVFETIRLNDFIKESASYEEEQLIKNY